MNAAFDAQPFDEPWRTVTERKLRQAFVNHPGATLIEVECRQTLCKLKVLRRQGGRHKHDIKGATADGMQEEDGFIGSHEIMAHGDRVHSEATVYVSRNHYSLPDKDGRVREFPKQKPNP